MEIKKYLDIERCKESYASTFEVGEPIVIQTKIDGSNASIAYDSKTNSLVAFSRRQMLNEMNTLNGFWNYVQSLDVKTFAEILGDRYIIFGEWLCLSGDTIIKKVSSGKGKSKMTLKEMYEKKYTPRYKNDEICKRGINKLLHLLYNNEEITKNNFNSKYKLDKETTINKALKEGLIIEKNEQYIITEKGINKIKEYYFSISTWGHDGFPSIYSLNLEEDQIISNKIQDIVYTGKKMVYRITTHKGYTIKATANHPFLTPKGWVEVKNLSIYDCVAVTDFINRNEHSRKYGIGTRQIFKKQKEYKDKIGKCEICGNTTGLNLHHIDENHFNNEESNWQILCQDCHGKIHTKFSNIPKFEYEFDYIIDIEEVGEEDCYDICMMGGENVANFIANNFIVHNCKHSVKYPEDMYKKFYMFDVWDRETEQYLTQEDSLAIFDRLRDYIPHYVHTLYNGPFISWEHTLAFLKENIYGETPCMEGIVIKRQNKLWSKSSRLPYYVKIVNEKFSEVHSSKPKTIDPEKLAAREAEQAAVAEVVTKRRIIKQIEKFIEDQIIPSDWGGESMKQISKLLPKAVYEDCRKEEPEAVITVENFGKICASLCMKYAREILDDKSKFLKA